MVGMTADGQALTRGTLVRVVQATVMSAKDRIEIGGVRRLRVTREWRHEELTLAQVAWMRDEVADDPESAQRARALGEELNPLLDEWVREVVEGRWQRRPNHLRDVMAKLGARPAPTSRRRSRCGRPRSSIRCRVSAFVSRSGPRRSS